MERCSWANGARLLLHLFAAINLAKAVYHDYRYAQLPELAVTLRLEPPLWGMFKYITFLGGLLQSGYYALALTHDLWRLPSLRNLRDYILATFVVPLALTASLTFWSLYAIDRNAIYPGLLDSIYPGWLNHVLHSYIAVYALIEFVSTRHRYPDRSRGFVGLAAFMAGYLVWNYYFWFRTAIWVYPFLGGTDWYIQVLYFALIIVVAFVYYLVGEHVNRVLWVKTTGDMVAKKVALLSLVTF
ncbi:androgen-induced gene 1 protein-like [Drosophila gunungcola]|uniref:androgen-induced gene 1 protein-like n=1 Tax=Drosophila gunungcola TaxID=103775 RepID=UPI0022E085CA|nr:androgen-induced gene 1 protein-like [Drosophila gunungcola]